MRRFVIFLIVVAILLVVADRVSVRIAQREVGQQIEDSASVSQRPAVTIHGFPFLTQALHGRYTRIDADLADLSVQDGLTVDTLHVDLRGLQVSLNDLINGTVGRVPVSSATSVATVSYASLRAAVAANSPDRNFDVKFAPGQDNQVAITGTYSGPQLKLQITAQAKVSVRNGALVVGLNPATIAALPAQIRSQLQSLIGDQGYELPRLPFGFEATAVTVGPTGITVRANATSVKLG